MKNNVGIVLLALQLSGCSPIPTPPAGLPPLAAPGVPVKRCTGIAGRYRDSGVAISGSGSDLGPASLTRVLHLHQQTPPADMVVLRGPRDDVLYVESIRANRPVASLKKQLIREIHAKYKPLGFACTDGFVPFHLAMQSGSLAPVPVAGFSGYELWLRRAADGSLIVVEIRSGAAVVGVIPWGSIGTIWYSFAPSG